MKPILFFIGLFITLCASGVKAAEYNILDFGATPDTSVLSTEAIQKAIDQCSANGGGTVIIPAGHFKTGTLIIKSYVGLYLEQGAVLFGSRNIKDYKAIKPDYISLRTQEATVQLIYAENAEHISITGFGEINGQGSGFKKMSWNDEGITRPHLLRFIGCRQVTMENITLKNSACWMQHYLACEEMQISGLRIINRNNFNNDGIDIDGCRNVVVSDIISDSDDDGITLKSTSPRPCENVTITNCVISSRCNAIKMGTESNGGFKNISITNCVIKPSLLNAPAFFGNANGTSGISLEIVDGGTMMGIVISTIEIQGTESPLFIRLGNRARSYSKNIEIKNVGILTDITISHILIHNAGNIGCSITGQPGFPVRNIRLSDIYFEQAGGCSTDEIYRQTPEKPKDYPEATMFGSLPAYGFYIRHASNVQFENCACTYQEKDMRPAIFLEDVENASFSNMQLKSETDSPSGMIIQNGKDIIIKNSVLQGSASCFIKVNGKDNGRVSIIGNIVENGTRIVIHEDSNTQIIDQGNLILHAQ